MLDSQPPEKLTPSAPIVWKERATWFDDFGAWLQPYLDEVEIARLKAGRRKPYKWDDHFWLDKVLAGALLIELDELVENFASYLQGRTLRTFHGCRVADAGVFHSEGLKVNDPAELETLARLIVAEEPDLEWMRSSIDQRLAEFDDRERDAGRLYVVLDDRALTERASHYALYGSEWLMVFFGLGGQRVLRERGVPTILQVDLPLADAPHSQTVELARKLLQEWTHVTVNRRDWSPVRDFSFILRTNIAPARIVGHYHPAVLPDTHAQKVGRVTAITTCPSCRAVEDGVRG